jgi:photosystem II stability/assembly factor-like uncharacterized protein
LAPSQTAWQWFAQPIERNSWRRLPIIAEDVRAGFFSDARHGWAVGGTILATVDGGATWRPQSSGTQQTLWSVHFADASRGGAVGGTILATVDGGATWKPQSSGTQQTLWSVHFADASRAGPWAMGARSWP